MGAVYKGRQLSLDRDIAIKVLPREMGESEEFRESFISEAKAMARLDHSNLLGIYDYGTVEGMPYIVMQYVDGGSLHDAAYNIAVELMQAVTIVRGICEGLAHAHANGIVHRDIKPSNILLTHKVEPKIADFGLAHAADSDKPGLVMGTPGYTAPEVFQDFNQAGPLADIYSVGVILHQLLTGIDPAGSMEPPNHPSGSLRLDLIWRKATHIDPAQRYQNVDVMIADLDAWIKAKQKLGLSASPAVLQKPRRPVLDSTSGSDGNVIGKMGIIGILVVLIVVAYMVLNEGKEEIQNTNTTTQNTQPGSADIPKPKPEPKKPVSLPPLKERPVLEPEPANSDEDDEDQEDDEPEAPVMAQEDDEPEPEPSENLGYGDPELRQRASELIAEARKKRDKTLSDNASALRFSLSPLTAGANTKLKALLEKVKEDIVNNRIPLVDDVPGLPEKISSAYKTYYAKEETIDLNYRSDLTRIRDAYVSRLKGASDNASDKNLKARLDAQADEAVDLDQWIALLSPEPQKVTINSTGGAFGIFEGNWEVNTGESIERWTANSNGKIEVEDKEWLVSWEFLDDGTLQIIWEDKQPFKLKRDGEGWSGETSGGGAVSLKPED